MAEAMQFSIQGIPGVLEGLRRMSERVEKRAVKRAVRAAAKPIVATIKSNLLQQGSQRSGVTRESIGAVIRSYKGSAITVAVMGPRRGFETTYRGRAHDPAKIGHLIERGHKATGWYREMGGARVAAKPFIRPAIDQHRQSTQVIVAAAIRVEIQAASRGG